MIRFTVEPEDSYTSRVGSNLSLPCSVADRRGLVQWTRWCWPLMLLPCLFSVTASDTYVMHSGRFLSCTHVTNCHIELSHMSCIQGRFWARRSKSDACSISTLSGHYHDWSMAAIMIVMVKMGSCDVLQKDVVRLRLHPGHHQRHHAGRCQVPMPGSSLRDHQLLQDSQV